MRKEEISSVASTKGQKQMKLNTIVDVIRHSAVEAIKIGIIELT